MLKNSYIGLTMPVFLELGPSIDPDLYEIGIAVEYDEHLLKDLYMALAASRNQRFFFILPPGDIPECFSERIIRFFFLSNYCLSNHAPLLLVAEDDRPNLSSLLNGCATQGVSQPTISFAVTFPETGPKLADFLLIPSPELENFLAVLLNKYLKFEWFFRSMIFTVRTKDGLQKVAAECQNFKNALEKGNPALFNVMNVIEKLENEKAAYEKLIRFQDNEINDLKLYNQLILGEDPLNPISVDTEFDNLYVLKMQHSRLKNESTYLRKLLIWYKKTYEERSLLGVIKEKLFKKNKS